LLATRANNTVSARNVYVAHKQIWAPWRLDYVTGAAAASEPAEPRPAQWLDGADQNCFLCRDVAEHAGGVDPAAQQAADRTNLVVRHSPLVISVLNLFPYNNGHVLIAPRRHLAELSDLTDDEHLALMAATTHTMAALRRLMKPDGFNVGLNLGKVAGAGLPGHLHWHVVPRWNGDTNYMSAVAGVRVIPQALEAMWEALSREL
jgi:ATP adenylyltransferase